MKNILAQKLNRCFMASAKYDWIHEYNSSKAEPVTKMTGLEFDNQARLLSSALRKLPIHNRRLIVLLDAGFNFLNTLISCIYSGITIIPCAIPANKIEVSRLQTILDDSQCKCMIIQKRDEQELKENFFDYDFIVYEDLMAESTLREPAQDFLDFNDEVAVIQYSSGSTQLPKGILVTGKMILANQKVVETRWKMDSQVRSLTWLPHFHDMGLFGGLLYPIMANCWVMMLSPNDFIKHPTRWLKIISEYKITLTGGPPFAYELAAKYSPESLSQHLDLSHWRLAFCGADYVPAKIKSEFVAKFSESGFDPRSFFSCYGLAETVLFVGGEPAGEKIYDVQDPEVKGNGLLPCYLGENHIDIGIFDPDTLQPMREGEEGEICISGESIADRYCSSEIPSFFYKKRWLRTADIGVISNHWLTVTARIKDIIKVRGKTIHPVDLAICANKVYPDLNQHAFYMELDTLKDDLTFSIESWKKKQLQDTQTICKNLQKVFSDNFGIFVKNINVLSRNSLPRTSSGKIKRWSSGEKTI